MSYKIGKYSFGKGNKKIVLCPLCLEELKETVHNNCLPNGKVLIKKKNHALLRIKRNEPVIKRLLKISNNEKDYSTEFIVLYVDKILVGYKGENKIMFVPGFLNEKYKQILRDYTPRNERRKEIIEIDW